MAFQFFFRRLLFMVVVLVCVSIVTFAVSNLVPGDPARLAAGPQASAETVERMRRDLGLDQPAWRQYLDYAGRLVRLDFGVSNVSGRPVLTEILSRVPASVELLGGGLFLALLAGIPLGVWAAINKGGPPDVVTRVASVFGAATPAFWLGLVLIVIFYRQLYWFPSSGRFLGAAPANVTGLMTVDSLLAGDMAAFRTAVAYLVLPVATIALLEMGLFARLMRNQLVGVLSQDYIRVARASGLSEWQVIRRHALRNAISPLVTVVASSLAVMLYGSASIETVFGWPGAGKYVVDSIFALDFPVVMGFAVLASVAYVVVNAVADVVYGLLDPRVRIQ